MECGWNKKTRGVKNVEKRFQVFRSGNKPGNNKGTVDSDGPFASFRSSTYCSSNTVIREFSHSVTNNWSPISSTPTGR